MNFNPSDYDKAVSLYREWNEKINVVSRKDIDNLWEHHILHSLALVHYLRDVAGCVEPLSILDVGTGGGFPGIPMAMALPSCEFTLCDSIGKKILVAQNVAAGLGLTNVRCLNCRAESVEGKFDYVVSRAVTSLDNFYPWVKGKYKRGILLLKGGDVQEEIAQMRKKFKVDISKFRVWPLSEWTDDDYFAEKFVIEIKI